MPIAAAAATVAEATEKVADTSREAMEADQAAAQAEAGRPAKVVEATAREVWVEGKPSVCRLAQSLPPQSESFQIHTEVKACPQSQGPTCLPQ